MEYVKNNEIVLNIGFEATSALKLGNEFVEFKARFGGVSREIIVPIDHVVAIYARENGQGMAFPMPTETRRAPRRDQPAARAWPAPGEYRAGRRRRPGCAGSRRRHAGSRRARRPPAGAQAHQIAPPTIRSRAGLAQLVEHPPCKRKVVRSIRTAGTTALRRGSVRDEAQAIGDGARRRVDTSPVAATASSASVPGSGTWAGGGSPVIMSCAPGASRVIDPLACQAHTDDVDDPEKAAEDRPVSAARPPVTLKSPAVYVPDHRHHRFRTGFPRSRLDRRGHGGRSPGHSQA